MSGIDESDETVEIRKDKWDDFTSACALVAQHINQYFSIDLICCCNTDLQSYDPTELCPGTSNRKSAPMQQS